jgi:PAS domain S-box-containing protein
LLSNLRRRLRAFLTNPADREKILEDLRASEAKFSGILAIAADAIITVDGSERIVHFNQGAASIFGYAPEEAIGRQLDFLIPKRVRGVHHEHMRRFAASPVQARRMGERREIFGVRRDGAEFPAEASISKLDGPAGPLYTVVLRDITDRRQAQEDERFLADAATEMARSLEDRAVIQTITDLAVPRLGDVAIINIIEADGSIRRIGSATAGSGRDALVKEIAKTGLSWESPWPTVDVMRRGVPELITNIDDEWIEAHEELDLAQAWRTLALHSMLIVPLVAGGQTVGALNIILVDPKRAFTADSRTLVEKFARPVALALVNSALYTTVQRATQARDEVMNVVSHDLRNPLSAIAMCARVLAEHTAGVPEDAGLVATVSESVETMNRLIQDLVDVASIERGQLSLERSETSPARIVERTAHMFEHEAKEHGITLTRDVEVDLPELLVDESRDVQVLSNLVRNAIKFTPDGGTITLGVASADALVRFSVTDTGLGIDPALHERIFDRYWHASAGARKRGTGLGLSIAKGIVEAHGGRMSVASDVGEGSTFFFTIPVTAHQEGKS